MRAISERAVRWLLLFLAAWSAGPAPAEPVGLADTVYLNGRIHTVDADNSVVQALAVRGGRIVFVGSNADARRLIGHGTVVEDLRGRTVLPGLVDAHMHPLGGGAILRQCYLNYEALAVAELKRRIQQCLDTSKGTRAHRWLIASAWYQGGTLTGGRAFDRALLDELRTDRPIVVRSSFAHSVVVNSKALALAGITRATPDPAGGRIGRDASGELTGLLEDAAQRLVEDLIPPPSATEDAESARAALRVMAAQGITGFLDALASERTIGAFAAVERASGLTARANFAVFINPSKAAADEAKVVEDAVALAHRFDQPASGPEPQVAVRNAKIMLDGISTAPENTGALLEPYRVNHGTLARPDWRPGTDRGPDPLYVPAPLLRRLVVSLARHGLEPHIHAVGDRSVREALDSFAGVRAAFPDRDIRLSIAHADLVDPTDFARFAQLDVQPTLSFQWAKPAPEYERSRGSLGERRSALLEPAGLLKAKGARISYGSDWPVDRLNPWFALQVALTRQADRSSIPYLPGRLGIDPGLSILEAIRAMTIDAAHQLHQDHLTGSLEVGKLADLIVLDRDVFGTAPTEIAKVAVLRTIVGGKTVYRLR